MLKIISTTDYKYIGDTIPSIEQKPITFSDDILFFPDFILLVSDGVWRLSNANYVIEVTNKE